MSAIDPSKSPNTTSGSNSGVPPSTSQNNTINSQQLSDLGDILLEKSAEVTEKNDFVPVSAKDVEGFATGNNNQESSPESTDGADIASTAENTREETALSDIDLGDIQIDTPIREEKGEGETDSAKGDIAAENTSDSEIEADMANIQTPEESNSLNGIGNIDLTSIDAPVETNPETTTEAVELPDISLSSENTEKEENEQPVEKPNAFMEATGITETIEENNATDIQTPEESVDNASDIVEEKTASSEETPILEESIAVGPQSEGVQAEPVQPEEIKEELSASDLTPENSSENIAEAIELPNVESPESSLDADNIDGKQSVESLGVSDISLSAETPDVQLSQEGELQTSNNETTVGDIISENPAEDIVEDTNDSSNDNDINNISFEDTTNNEIQSIDIQPEELFGTDVSENIPENTETTNAQPATEQLPESVTLTQVEETQPEQLSDLVPTTDISESQLTEEAPAQTIEEQPVYIEPIQVSEPEPVVEAPIEQVAPENIANTEPATPSIESQLDTISNEVDNVGIDLDSLVGGDLSTEEAPATPSFFDNPTSVIPPVSPVQPIPGGPASTNPNTNGNTTTAPTNVVKKANPKIVFWMLGGIAILGAAFFAYQSFSGTGNNTPTETGSTNTGINNEDILSGDINDSENTTDIIDSGNEVPIEDPDIIDNDSGYGNIPDNNTDSINITDLMQQANEEASKARKLVIKATIQKNSSVRTLSYSLQKQAEKLATQLANEADLSNLSIYKDELDQISTSLLSIDSQLDGNSQ